MSDTLRRVALFDADGADEAGAARLLLEDFADALCAYARMGGSETPGIIWLDHGDQRHVEHADALVIAFTACEPGPSGRMLPALDSLTARPTPLYALCRTDSFDPADALPAVDALAARCADAGAPWRGGVIVGGGALVARTASSPRMGTLRRWRSEATDALVAAVRLGVSVEDAARITRDTTRVRRGGIILARCPVPRPIYRALCR